MFIYFLIFYDKTLLTVGLLIGAPHDLSSIFQNSLTDVFKFSLQSNVYRILPASNDSWPCLWHFSHLNWIAIFFLPTHFYRLSKNSAQLYESSNFWKNIYSSFHVISVRNTTGRSRYRNKYKYAYCAAGVNLSVWVLERFVESVDINYSCKIVNFS